MEEINNSDSRGNSDLTHCERAIFVQSCETKDSNAVNIGSKAFQQQKKCADEKNKCEETDIASVPKHSNANHLKKSCFENLSEDVPKNNAKFSNPHSSPTKKDVDDHSKIMSLESSKNTSDRKNSLVNTTDVHKTAVYYHRNVMATNTKDRAPHHNASNYNNPIKYSSFLYHRRNGTLPLLNRCEGQSSFSRNHQIPDKIPSLLTTKFDRPRGLLPLPTQTSNVYSSAGLHRKLPFQNSAATSLKRKFNLLKDKHDSSTDYRLQDIAYSKKNHVQCSIQTNSSYLPEDSKLMRVKMSERDPRRRSLQKRLNDDLNHRQSEQKSPAMKEFSQNNSGYIKLVEQGPDLGFVDHTAKKWRGDYTNFHSYNSKASDLSSSDHLVSDMGKSNSQLQKRLGITDCDSTKIVSDSSNNASCFIEKSASNHVLKDTPKKSNDLSKSVAILSPPKLNPSRSESIQQEPKINPSRDKKESFKVNCERSEDMDVSEEPANNSRFKNSTVGSHVQKHMEQKDCSRYEGCLKDSGKRISDKSPRECHTKYDRRFKIRENKFEYYRQQYKYSHSDRFTRKFQKEVSPQHNLGSNRYCDKDGSSSNYLKESHIKPRQSVSGCSRSIEPKGSYSKSSQFSTLSARDKNTSSASSNDKNSVKNKPGYKTSTSKKEDNYNVSSCKNDRPNKSSDSLGSKNFNENRGKVHLKNVGRKVILIVDSGTDSNKNDKDSSVELSTQTFVKQSDGLITNEINQSFETSNDTSASRLNKRNGSNKIHVTVEKNSNKVGTIKCGESSRCYKNSDCDLNVISNDSPATQKDSRMLVLKSSNGMKTNRSNFKTTTEGLSLPHSEIDSAMDVDVEDEGSKLVIADASDFVGSSTKKKSENLKNYSSDKEDFKCYGSNTKHDDVTGKGNSLANVSFKENEMKDKFGEELLAAYIKKACPSSVFQNVLSKLIENEKETSNLENNKEVKNITQVSSLNDDNSDDVLNNKTNTVDLAVCTKSDVDNAETVETSLEADDYHFLKRNKNHSHSSNREIVTCKDDSIENKSSEPVKKVIKNTTSNVRSVCNKRKRCKSELDKLHDDIKEMFILPDVLKINGMRSCRLKSDPKSEFDSDCEEVIEKNCKKAKLCETSKGSHKTSKSNSSVTENIKQKHEDRIVKKSETLANCLSSITREKRVKDNSKKRDETPIADVSSKVEPFERASRDDGKEIKCLGLELTPKTSLPKANISIKSGVDEEVYLDNNFNVGQQSILSIKDDDKIKNCKIVINKLTNVISIPNNAPNISVKNGKTSNDLFSSEVNEDNSYLISSFKTNVTDFGEIDLEQSLKTVNSSNADKDYYQNKDFKRIIKCKLCAYRNKSIALVRHYKTEHPNSEVLISRLSQDIVDEALQPFKADHIIPCKSSKNIYSCWLCLRLCSRAISFYDHISSHTGEYRYSCLNCSYEASNNDAIKTHFFKEHYDKPSFKTTDKNTKKVFFVKPLIGLKDIVLGYFCLECNFVQLNRYNVERHVQQNHSYSKLDSKVGVINFSREYISTSSSNILPLKRVAISTNNKGVENESIATRICYGVPDNNNIDKNVNIDAFILSEPIECEEESNQSRDMDALKGLADKIAQNFKTVAKSHESIQQLSSKLSVNYNTADSNVTARSKARKEASKLCRKSCSDKKRTANEQNLNTIPVKNNFDYSLSNSTDKLVHENYSITLEECMDISSDHFGRHMTDDDNNSVNTSKHFIQSPPFTSSTCNVSSIYPDVEIIDPMQNVIIESVVSLDPATLPKFSTVDNSFNHSFTIKKEIESTPEENRSSPGVSHCNSSYQGLPIDEGLLQTSSRRDCDDFKKQVPEVQVVQAHNRQPQLDIAAKDINIFNLMRAPKKLRHLFKCAGRTCSFTCDSSKKFEIHCHNHIDEIFIKPNTGLNDWQSCVYCNEAFGVPSDLCQHIEQEHSQSVYQCAYCFYRAVCSSNVAIHQSISHESQQSHILHCLTTNTSPLFQQRQQIKRSVIQPYICTFELCGAKFIMLNEFENHVLKHNPLIKYQTCGYCDEKLGIDSLIEHYKEHSINLYQCSYCNQGTDAEKLMRIHLCIRHPDLEPHFIKRVPENC